MGKVQFEEPLKFLNIVGLDPRNQTRFSKSRRFLVVALFSLTLIFALLELLFNFKGLETCSRASESMIVQYQIGFKIYLLIMNEGQIIKLIRDSSKFWGFDTYCDYNEKCRSELVHKPLRLFYKVYKILLVLMTVQYISGKFIYKSDKPLAIFYNENKGFSPMNNQLIFLLHAISTIDVFFIVVGFDGLFFYFLGHILSELRLVRNFFENIQESEISTTIKHHKFILRYIEKLNRIYSNLLLNQHLSCLFGICFGLFLMSKDGTPDFGHVSKYLPYVMSFVVQTFTFCFVGSLINDWSLKIPDVIFHNEWSQNKTYYKEKIIAIGRGQKAAGLTLGRFGNLDLESFAIVIKNSFSFFTFINTMNEK